jgi:cellobiose phosphorylase
VELKDVKSKFPFIFSSFSATKKILNYQSQIRFTEEKKQKNPSLPVTKPKKEKEKKKRDCAQKSVLEIKKKIKIIKHVSVQT